MPTNDEQEFTLVNATVFAHLCEVVRPVVIETPSGPYGGSGQVLHVGGRYLLVTAAHNLGEGKQVFRIGLTPGLEVTDRTIHWLDGERAVVTATSVTLTHAEDGRTASATLDVAIVEIFDAEVAKLGIVPVPLDQVMPLDVEETDWVFVLGYPGAMYDRSRAMEGILRAKYLGFGTVGAPESEWHSTWHPAVHQVARWPSTGVNTLRNEAVVPGALPPPEGISGCAMWLVPPRPGKIFNPQKDPVFVGIQYAYAKEMIVGCNASVMMSLAVKAFPELQELVRDRGFNLAREYTGPA